MNKLLLNPETVVNAATAILNEPLVSVGTTVTMRYRVTSAVPVSVAPGKEFWSVQLVPVGPVVKINDQDVWIESPIEVAP